MKKTEFQPCPMCKRAKRSFIPRDVKYGFIKCCYCDFRTMVFELSDHEYRYPGVALHVFSNKWNGAVKDYLKIKGEPQCS